MGFDKQAALFALSVCNNDIELAMQYLLKHGVPHNKEMSSSNNASISNNNNDNDEIINELLESGFSLNEAQNAINMSKNVNLFCNLDSNLNIHAYKNRNRMMKKKKNQMRIQVIQRYKSQRQWI